MTVWRAYPIAALLICLWAGAARAGLTRQDVGSVGAHPAIGAQLPLDATYATQKGGKLSLRRAIGKRPTLLVFADLTCTTLCGVTLSTVSEALKAMPREPGKDYSLIVASIDPKDNAADASHMADVELGEGAVAEAATFLIGQGVDKLAAAAGYSYVYDAENDVYAHPVGLYILEPDGRIARYLPGLRVEPPDLQRALDEADAGTTTPVASTLLLLCYRFDPVTGVYTPAIARIMAIAGIMTAIVIAVGVFLLIRRERRSAASGGGG